MGTRVETLKRGAIVAIALFVCPRCPAADAPANYVLEYPAVVNFVPPIEGFFEEVASTISRVGRRTFRHQPNGGYGLPVRARAGGKNLLHLGADVGWHRFGEPVLAVANGVVRVSQLPIVKQSDDESQAFARATQWGGVIAIEHRLSDEHFVTTVYGHLDTRFLVARGDIVEAGQPIGTIGAKRVNGGYTPHLHFGVRTGRMVESGRQILPVNVNGRITSLAIRSVTESVVALESTDDLPPNFQVVLNGRTFDFHEEDGTVEVDAGILWHVQPLDFAIIGYGLTTDGWRDPVQFLRDPHGE